jgi:hypothetical protein
VPLRFDWRRKHPRQQYQNREHAGHGTGGEQAARAAKAGFKCMHGEGGYRADLLIKVYVRLIKKSR